MSTRSLNEAETEPMTSRSPYNNYSVFQNETNEGWKGCESKPYVLTCS